MSKSEIDNLKSRFADGVSTRLRGGGERQSGRYSDIYDFDTPKANKKTPVKPKSASTSDKKKVVVRTPMRATSPRRALSPRRATSPRPRPSQKKKIVSTPANKSKSDSVKTFKTPKSATKNAPSTSTPKSNKSSQQVKKRKTDDGDSEGPNDSSSKKRKREAESDSKNSTKKRSTIRKRVSFRGDDLDSHSSKSSRSSKTPKDEEKVDESDNSGSWWFCNVM